MKRMLILSSLLTWVTCGSDKPASPEKQIVGAWSGVAEKDVGTSHVELRMGFQFSKDGTFILDFDEFHTGGGRGRSQNAGIWDDGILRLQHDSGGGGDPWEYTLNGETMTIFFTGHMLVGHADSIRLTRSDTLPSIHAQQDSSLAIFEANSSDRQHVSAEGRSRDSLRVVLDSNVLFSEETPGLKQGAAMEFVKAATFIHSHSTSKFIVEVRDEVDNERLSQLRAEVVREMLVDSYEFITDDMIEAKGYGEKRPQAGDSPANKPLPSTEVLRVVGEPRRD